MPTMRLLVSQQADHIKHASATENHSHLCESWPEGYGCGGSRRREGVGDADEEGVGGGKGVGDADGEGVGGGKGWGMLVERE